MSHTKLTGKAKIAAIAAGIAIVALAWIGVIVAATMFDVSRETKLVLVLGAALLTEVVLWVGGALLGIAAFQKVRGWMRLRAVAKS